MHECMCAKSSLINILFSESGHICHVFMTLKCILTLHTIPCFICPCILGLLFYFHLGAHNIKYKEYKELLEVVQCSRKQKLYWIGSSSNIQTMAG